MNLNRNILKVVKSTKYLHISYFETVLHIVFELGLDFGQHHSLKTNTPHRLTSHSSRTHPLTLLATTLYTCSLVVKLYH